MSRNSDAPRLIVLIVGQMRTVQHTIANLRTHLTNYGDTRILVQCPRAELSLASETFEDAMIDAWDPDPQLPFYMRYAWPFLGNSGREQGKLKPSFYFQLVRQYRAATIFADQIDSERDWVLKWRPDLMLLEPLDWRSLVCKKSALWIPKHDNYGGINDQCALGPAKLMRTYLQRLERIDHYLAANGYIHYETFLRWALNDQPIERMPLFYCIHRGDHLNGVSMKRADLDVHDPVLADKFKAAGVSVDLDPDTEAIEFKAGIGQWIRRLWDFGLSLMFRGKSVANAAVSHNSPH